MAHSGGDENEILLSFDSTTNAIRAERLLLAAGLPVRVMNLPAAVKAGCGIGLRVAAGLLPQARARLREGGIQPAAIHIRNPENGGSYTPLEVQDA